MRRFERVWQTRHNAGVRPLLLLDIDGPLNPMRASWFSERVPAPGYEFHELTPAGGVTYRVALSPRHGQRLRELARESFELVWATTWLEDANELVAPLLDLPNDLPVIPLDRPPIPRGKRSWKAEQISDWVGGRPFVWFDDEINRATRDWLASVRLTDHLAYRVEPHIGLIDADFEAFEHFAQSL